MPINAQAGDSPTSRRLFDAVAAGCIPVIVSDNLDPRNQRQVVAKAHGISSLISAEINHIGFNA